MSGALVSYTTHLNINDINIEVKTSVDQGFQEVQYTLKSSKTMDPPTVAVALYLMCHDICGKINIEVDDLVEGLVDSSSEMH